MTDLLHKAKYTIDMSSLTELFHDERKYCKKHFVTLWLSIEQMIKIGEIVSHIQVYDETVTRARGLRIALESAPCS